MSAGRMPVRRSQGFTLVELMVVVAIIAIIASTAVPKLLASRLASGESAAISTLRNITAAQSQIERTVAIDVNLDGAGEFGYFGEMAGTVDLRDFSGIASGRRLQPPVLPVSLGRVNGAGHVTDAGYMFRMFLPAAGGAPLSEAPGGGSRLGDEDPQLASNTWVCYAWPRRFGNTGNRAFALNQVGEMVQTDNLNGIAGSYSGTTEPTAVLPLGDAAFSQVNDITSAIQIGGVGQDGNTWRPVQ